MVEGLRKYYLGDFNRCSVEANGDEVPVYTISKDGENKVYRFKVRDLYGPNEEVLEHKVIEVKG